MTEQAGDNENRVNSHLSITLLVIKLVLLAGIVVLSASCSYLTGESHYRFITLCLFTDRDINQNSAGEPSPVVVTIVSLSEASFTDESDYFELTGQGATDGVVRLQEIVMKPGEKRQLRLRIPDEAIAVGVIGGYRDIQHTRWKSSYTFPQYQALSRWQRLIRTRPKVFSVHVQKSAVIIGETE